MAKRKKKSHRKTHRTPPRLANGRFRKRKK
jgi:hypothetical protein